MSSKFVKFVRPVDVRVVLFLISVALFVIGAGAPAATGW
jgi:hypothetical protein